MKSILKDTFAPIVWVIGFFCALFSASCFLCAAIGSGFSFVSGGVETFLTVASSLEFPKNVIFAGTILGWWGALFILIGCALHECIKIEPEKPKQKTVTCGTVASFDDPICRAYDASYGNPIRLPLTIHSLSDRLKLVDANKRSLGTWPKNDLDNLRLVVRNVNRYDALVGAVEEMLPIVEAHEKATKKSGKKSKIPYCASFNLRKIQALLAWAKIQPDQQYEI